MTIGPLGKTIVVGVLGLGTAAIGAAAIAPAFSGKSKSAPAQASAPAVVHPASSAGIAGMTVHIDPRTGAVLSEPAPGTAPLTLSPSELNARSTSGEGLVVEQSPIPGGGFKIDLQGRFQSPLIATIGANGKVRMQHLPETPATSDRR